jgi:protein ImuB
VPVREDTFRADAFSVEGVGEIAKEAGFKLALHIDCAVPLRRFRPPREVAVAHKAGNRFPVPLAILSGTHKGEILRKRGPFLSSGAWWDTAVAWQRLEWDVELADGMVRLAFLKPEKWELGGRYE